MGRPILQVSGFAAFLLLVAVDPSPAQTLHLRVVEESGAGVPGAIVRLLGPIGEVARGLTDEVGRLILQAPLAGAYRVRVDRIGWAAVLSDPVTLSAGEPVRITVPVTSARVDLPAIEVQAQTSCQRHEAMDPMATVLLEEIHKALAAHVASQASMRLRRRVTLHELDADGAPIRETLVASDLTEGPPFESLPPALLAREGFVIGEVGREAVFAAPDAALLLSDEFVRQHCFHVVRGSDGLIGLSFEPVPERRVPDIMGVLWVERLTGELKALDFNYTHLPRFLDGSPLGGRVEFQRLDTGAWIISAWRLRMPVIETRVMQSRRETREIHRLAGFIERRGTAAPVESSRLSHGLPARPDQHHATFLVEPVELGGRLRHAAIDFDCPNARRRVVPESEQLHADAIHVHGHRAVHVRLAEGSDRRAAHHRVAAAIHGHVHAPEDAAQVERLIPTHVE